MKPIFHFLKDIDPRFWNMPLCEDVKEASKHPSYQTFLVHLKHKEVSLSEDLSDTLFFIDSKDKGLYFLNETSFRFTADHCYVFVVWLCIFKSKPIIKNVLYNSTARVLLRFDVRWHYLKIDDYLPVTMMG